MIGKGLDNWITGHYGVDQDMDEPEIIEDEGIAILQSACDYLEERWQADEDEQITGEYEAYSIMQDAIWRIGEDYKCYFCGQPINRRKDKYCSKNCYIADREGL